jgi:hypothetical protein
MMTNKRQPKNTLLIVICPHCKAPSPVPPEVEQRIEDIDGFDCWDCNHKTRVSKDFKYFVIATRED